MRAGTPAMTTLTEQGREYTLHPYRSSTHPDPDSSYGAEAAAALQVAPQQLFKTLITSVDGRLVCAVVPVSGRLNLKALASAVGGKKAELAEPAQAQRATGYVIGGISPLGHRTQMPVVVDESAQLFEHIYVSAGKRGVQLRLSPADLIAAVAATTAAIAST